MEHISKTFSSVIVLFMFLPSILVIVLFVFPFNANEKKHFVIGPVDLTVESGRVIEGFKSGNSNPDTMAGDMEIESSSKESKNGKSKDIGCRR